MNDHSHPSHPSNPHDPPSASGGPRTAEGKERSSRNALKHGFTSRRNYVPEHMRHDFDMLHLGLRAELQPVGVLEGQIFDLLLNFRWKLCLIQEHQMQLLAAGDFLTDPARQSAFQLLTRYETTCHNAYRRCLADLKEQQNNRLALHGLGHTVSDEVPLPVTADVRYLHAATLQARAVNPYANWSSSGQPGSPKGHPPGH